MVQYMDDVLRKAHDRSTLVQFKNCLILKGHGLKTEHLWVECGKVADPAKIFFDYRRPSDIQVDCQGLIIAPGFIDVQINGGFGVDFSSDGAENWSTNVRKVAKGLLQFGVTSFCPTFISSQPAVYSSLLPLVDRLAGGPHGAAVLGLHLEGPFIALEKRGAHPEQNVISRDLLNNESFVQMLHQTYGPKLEEKVSVVTIAPELPGAEKAVQYLTSHGVCVSIGHSKGSLVDGERAVNAGASAITHLFNAMESYHHRDPGLIGLLASKYIPSDRTLFYGIISDGIHTHDSALRIAHRTHPEANGALSGLMLITDGVAALGMGDGHHKLGDQDIQVNGLRATISGSVTPAGSVASMPMCVRHLVKAARCSLVEAVECASLHPAQFLNISHQKGTLDYGADADFVLLDKDMNIKATFIAGQLVWKP